MILFLLSLTALTRDFGERPERPRLCRQDKVNACVQSESSLRQGDLNAISALEAQLAALGKERDSLAGSGQAMSAEIRAAEVSLAMAKREAKTVLAPASSTEIFPGGPKPEEIFFSEGANSWLEWHASQRRSRLNAVVNSSEKRIAELEPARRNLATEISTLEQQTNAIRGQIVSHQQNASAHESMCRSGCRDEFCPGN
jgi:hypothetical protein